MDRLQKKCFIVTAALHGLLIAVLLFGSALMPAREEENNVKLFTTYDASKVTDALSSGGDPDVKAPVPAPQQNDQPKPPAEPPPAKPEPPVAKPLPKPEPPKVEPPKITKPVHNDIPDLTEKKPKETKLTRDELTPISPKSPHKPTHDPVDLTPAIRKSDEKAKAAKAAQEAADAKEKARRKHEAQEFASALKSLGNNLSTKTLVEMTSGPGGGGEASINYRDLIASKYYNAWNPPAFLDEATTPVTAIVTIGRDGSVISARITKPSGNSSMDKSVSNVLETITFFEPFPENARENERTYTIKFNLQAKRQIG